MAFWQCFINVLCWLYKCECPFKSFSHTHLEWSCFLKTIVASFQLQNSLDVKHWSIYLLEMFFSLWAWMQMQQKQKSLASLLKTIVASFQLQNSLGIKHWSIYLMEMFFSLWAWMQMQQKQISRFIVKDNCSVFPVAKFSWYKTLIYPPTGNVLLVVGLNANVTKTKISRFIVV